MLLKLRDFCPPADAVTLLQFASDAYEAWGKAPPHQTVWLNEYNLITDLLDVARTVPSPWTADQRPCGPVDRREPPPVHQSRAARARGWIAAPRCDRP